MARDEAYQEAERRIEATRQEGATELNLSDIGLTEVLEAIAALTQLQTLNLFSNQLTELPAAIASLTQLQSLNLSDNQLTELPETIAVLTQLQSLNLSNNQLTKLPDALSRLTNLSYLNLFSNKLSIPTWKSSLKGSDIAVDWQTKRDSSEFEQGGAVRAEGSMLRELHSLLKEKDPGFGSLVQVQNKRREFLWVHPQFVGEY